MIDANLSEEEQVEALKKWWRDNGKSVIGGVVLGLGAVFGWQYWNSYQQGIAGEGSLMFAELSSTIAQGDNEAAAAKAQAMVERFDGRIYATFGALDLAKVKLAQGDVAAAEAALRQALAQAGDASLQQIARLRLARLQFSAGRLDDAEQTIAQAPVDSFAGEYAALRGDIARARGDREAAAAAYREALAGGAGNQALIQLKLDDLAVGS